jgi:hypothetical protein
MRWKQELFFTGQADRWSEKKTLSLPAAQFHLLGLVFPPNGTGKRGQLLSAWPCDGRNLKQLIRTRKEWTEQKESIPALSMISLRFCTAGKNSNELLQYLVIIASTSLRIP